MNKIQKKKLKIKWIKKEEMIEDYSCGLIEWNEGLIEVFVFLFYFYVFWY